MNRLRQAKKASVERSLTSSIWTALTVRDTNTHMYDLPMVGLRTCPYLISTGPALPEHLGLGSDGITSTGDTSSGD